MSAGITPTGYIVTGTLVIMPNGDRYIKACKGCSAFFYYVKTLLKRENLRSKRKKFKKNRIFFKNRLAIVEKRIILSNVTGNDAEQKTNNRHEWQGEKK